jgi:Tfp pilus assembly protein PilF
MTSSPETKDLGSALASAVTLLFMTGSITMLTDIIHRILSADPDGIGILSISLQVSLTLVASSTFTEAGWSLASRIFKPLNSSVYGKARGRGVLALGIFAITLTMWCFLPPALARIYNRRGYESRVHDPARALLDYERAIALNPLLPQAYVNLGGTLEGLYRYDDAVKYYQKAITANFKDPTPYSNLARLLLIDGKSATALQITNDALKLQPSDLEVVSALHKNRAWAEYNLNFPNQAIVDATESSSAAGDCILGKTYAKLGKSTESANAWSSFRKREFSPPKREPTIEPDCRLLAEEPHETQ